MLLLCWVHLEEDLNGNERNTPAKVEQFSRSQGTAGHLTGRNHLSSHATGNRVRSPYGQHLAPENVQTRMTLNEEQHQSINRTHLSSHAAGNRVRSPYGQHLAPESVQTRMNQSIKWTLSSTQISLKYEKKGRVQLFVDTFVGFKSRFR